MSSTAGSTLSPSTAASKAQPSKLRKPARVAPAGLRPRRNKRQFPLENLIKVPKRLLTPPRKTGMVGKVRSLSATPIGEVRLADVLDNKHLSPLSVRDFEGYLVFKAHSAENLYFILWLNEYTKEYEAWKKNPASLPTSTDEADPFNGQGPDGLAPYLRASLHKGLLAFFAPNAPLELNLPANIREKTISDGKALGTPEAFEAARDVIEHSLAHSLQLHARSACANASPRRLVFCFCLGLTVFLLGLVPPFVGIFGGYARGYRAIGLPFIMLGAAIMTMAVKRLCAVIWLLGEDRQLLPWELRPPCVLSGSLVSINCPSTPGLDSDTESTFSADSMEKGSASDPYPWEKQDSEAASAAVPVVTFSGNESTKASRPPSYTVSSNTTDVVPSSSNVWSPVTRVFSSDVARAQWAVAVFGFMVGALVMVTLGAVLMAVPNN